ncbi:hypothetical protein GCM10010276_27180 [Streptomyces longisporus]|uniref:Uncharacterized protein n=1 Tax=Streptomyces longisporus TaxID=1948 RepID=A0ABN3LNT6_STRLO
MWLPDHEGPQNAADGNEPEVASPRLSASPFADAEKTDIEVWLTFADEHLQRLTETSAAPKLPAPPSPDPQTWSRSSTAGARMTPAPAEPHPHQETAKEGFQQGAEGADGCPSPARAVT